MTAFAETFESAGPAGTVVATSNTGFDSAVGVDLESVASPFVGHGSLSLGVPGNSSDGYLVTNLPASTTSVYTQTYVYVETANAGATLFFLQWRNESATTLLETRINTDGTVAFRAGTLQDTSTQAFTAGDTFRLHVELETATDTFTAGLFYGANLEGATPDETLTGSIVNSGSYIGSIRVGNVIASASTGVLALDSVEWDDTSPIGPAGVIASAAYTLSTTYAQNQDDSANATYQIDATGSTGTVTLVQQSGTTAAPSESPTGVFTITDPGGTDTLVYLLTAGVSGSPDDTETINISRGAGRPLVYTFLGGDHTNPANWA